MIGLSNGPATSGSEIGTEWRVFVSVPKHVFKMLRYAARHIFSAIQVRRPDKSDLGEIDRYYRERYSPRRKGYASKLKPTMPRLHDSL